MLAWDAVESTDKDRFVCQLFFSVKAETTLLSSGGTRCPSQHSMCGTNIMQLTNGSLLDSLKKETNCDVGTCIETPGFESYHVEVLQLS